MTFATRGEEPLSNDDALVSPSRLPHELSMLLHPEAMLDREALSLVEHIYNGQHGRLPADRIFQFQNMCPDRHDDALREERHESSTLVYGPFSRLFVARILRQSPNDDFARAEIFFQLRHITLDTTAYVPLPDDDLAVLYERTANCPPLRKLLGYMASYEKTAPMHVRTFDTTDSQTHLF